MFTSIATYIEKKSDQFVIISSAIALLFAFVITAFVTEAHAQSGNVYSNNGAQNAQNAIRGVVLQVREVKVQPKQAANTVGALSGAALGGLFGAALGRNTDSSSRAVLGLIGAGLGGLGGQSVAENIGATTAIEILVETTRGNQTQVIAVVQPLPAPDVMPGQAVLILTQGGQNRVIPAAVNPVAHQYQYENQLSNQQPRVQPMNANWAN